MSGVITDNMKNKGVENMKRKVIGYDKTLEYLKKGYGVKVSPLGSSTYIYDKINNEFITVRSDVVSKLLRNNLVKSSLVGWSTVYYLK